MKTRTQLKRLLIVAVISMTCYMVQAQPGDPGPDPGGPGTSVPIDGGLSLLIAAGVGVAAKKAHDKRKRETTPDNS